MSAHRAGPRVSSERAHRWPTGHARKTVDGIDLPLLSMGPRARTSDVRLVGTPTRVASAARVLPMLM